MYGSGHENGEDFLMESGKLILVNMNYRLGPLGFLSTEDDIITGNFGLKDQHLALEWTKKNIAAFNGNPEKITVLGFSAGSGSVHLHLMNKNLENLAKSAVSISGTALAYWSIDRNATQKAHAVAKYLNCPTESSSTIKKCLQNRSAADIVRTIIEFHKPNFGYNPAMVFGPVLEPKTVKNAFITEEPELIIKSGKSAQIPWLVSYVKDDGGYNAAEFMKKDPKTGEEMIGILNERFNEIAPVNLFYKSYFKDNELEAFTDSVRQKYMGNKKFSTENYFLLQKMVTDFLFADGVRKSLALHKEYTQAPVYGYVYDNPAPFGMGHILSNRTDINFGTTHGDDFNLIFKTAGVDKKSFTDNQKMMSRNFVQMIENFCLTGKLQFGDCKFVENSPKTKEIFAMYITKDSCEPVNIKEVN